MILRVPCLISPSWLTRSMEIKDEAGKIRFSSLLRRRSIACSQSGGHRSSRGLVAKRLLADRLSLLNLVARHIEQIEVGTDERENADPRREGKRSMFAGPLKV